MDSTLQEVISTVSASLAPSIEIENIPENNNYWQSILRIIGIAGGIGIIGCIGYINDLKGFLQLISSLFQSIHTWWSYKLPSYKVLQEVKKNKTTFVIFVRDFFINPGTPLFSQEGINGSIGIVPNVFELWPRVEGVGLARLLGSLGKLEKTENIEIVEMGKDPGIWNKDLLIIGAQTQKCFDFYQKMDEVAFRVTQTDIIKQSTGRKITRQNGYGYGVIIKCKNPFVTDHKGIGILIGGFGVLGTEAATYYFSKHVADLGKQFGKKSFGIIVRASITGGVESVERMSKYDTVFK